MLKKTNAKKLDFLTVGRVITSSPVSKQNGKYIFAQADINIYYLYLVS